MCETTEYIQRTPMLVARLVETRETLRRLVEALKVLQPPELASQEAADGTPTAPVARHA